MKSLTWVLLGSSLSLCVGCVDDVSAVPLESDEAAVASPEAGPRQEGSLPHDTGLSGGPDAGDFDAGDLVDAVALGDAAAALDAAGDALGEPAMGETVPCDVAAILAAHCVSCHGDIPRAPMELLVPQDFWAASLTAAPAPMYEVVKARIHDPVRPMPPAATDDTLTQAELAVLDGWLDRGAPAAVDGCVVRAEAPQSVSGLPQGDCALVAEFRAHGGQTVEDITGYAPPPADDHNESFYFAIPWPDDTHGLWIEPIVEGGEQLVHHSILSVLGQSANPPGTHGATPSDEFASRTLMVGWAPGGEPLVVPDDVGLALPNPSAGLIQLEIHYNNPGRISAEDRSGFRVCTARQRRAETAVVHTLGDALFTLPPQPGLQTVRNACTVQDRGLGPVHVLTSMPHMHELGRRLVTTVERAATGEVETLIDKPFDFRDQTTYQTPMLIYPGDRVTTDCIYENATGEPVSYGEQTADEMCFNYVLAYPEGSLVGGSVSLVKENACISVLGI